MGRTESWIYFWSTLGAAVVLCVAEGRFTVERSRVTFDQALEACGQRAGGFLANIASMAEVLEVLGLLSDTVGQTSVTQTFVLWIGLKNGRTDCVVGDEPLRGFKWTVDVAVNPEVARWKEEPAQTCTATRCALLSVDLEGTSVVDWGLVSSSCQKEKELFLCKQGEAPQASCPARLDIPEALSQRTDAGGRLTVECSNGEIHTLHCDADNRTWTLSDGSATGAGVCPAPACAAGLARDASGGCVDVDECADPPGPCRDICTNTEGSYLCQCHDPLGNVHDEGSPACNALTATTAPPVELPDLNVAILVNTPTPQATILGEPSPSSPPASVEPPAPPTDASQVEVDKPERTSVFIPVLIAVMALVVVVVVVVVVVKCCLRRRSQKLAMKKAEVMAMKRSEAAKEDRLNGQDSLEHTSEKEAR